MATYTFHHYQGDAPAGISFGEFDSDPEALADARRLLERHSLTCVEVCEFRREVGAVRRTDGQIQVSVAAPSRSA
jgi:hypothetical protein